MFHSKTRRRKKQRVAAGVGSADLGSEVPNLGVARALFVILVLHVAAIAAIFIHNRVTEGDTAAALPETETSTAAIGGQNREELPVVQKGEDFYFITTGDTYERISRLKGVEVTALRELNNDMPLQAGKILRIPPARVAAAPKAPPAVAQNTAPGPDAESAPPVHEPAAAVRVSPSQSAAAALALDDPSVRPIKVMRGEPAPAIIVVEDRPDPAGSAAMRVTPNVDPLGDDGPAEAPAPAPAGRTYTVKQGDTAWGIAQSHRTSADRLLKENGIADARKLRIGMKLRIPAN